MLSKLLRHEFRATARILLPVYLVMLGSAALFSLFMTLALRYEDVPALNVFTGVSATVFVVTIVGASVLTLALMVYRFYKNYMTDEGYLMFTLPVSTSQLIWSKLLVALVWSAATLIITLLSVLLLCVIQPNIREQLPNIPELFRYLELTPGQLTLYGVEMALTALCGVLASFLMFYAAISLGHSFANHKVLLSVVFYFAFNMALQSIASFAGIYGLIGLDESGFFESLPDYTSLIHLGAGVSLLSEVLIGAVFYLVTHYMLRKRLNLQ